MVIMVLIGFKVLKGYPFQNESVFLTIIKQMLHYFYIYNAFSFSVVSSVQK